MELHSYLVTTFKKETRGYQFFSLAINEEDAKRQIRREFGLKGRLIAKRLEPCINNDLRLATSCQEV